MEDWRNKPTLPNGLCWADLPSSVQEVSKRLIEAGYQTFLVGGALRDLLIGLEPKDYDLATDTSAQELKTLFPKVIPTGIKHGTVTVITSNGEQIEISTFRGAAGSNSPLIIQDLSHRDFTINAMAFDLNEKNFIDPFGGYQDLQRRLLKTVGSSRERFLEDPLRMLRAIRLVVEKDLRLDSTLLAVIIDLREQLHTCSGERVRDELIKIVLSPLIDQGLCLLQKTGLCWQLPGLRHFPSKSHSEGMREIYQNVQYMSEDLPGRLAFLLTALRREHPPLDREEILRGLCFSNQTIQKIEDLMNVDLLNSKQLTNRELRRTAAKLGTEEQAHRWVELRFAWNLSSAGPTDQDLDNKIQLWHRLRKIFATDEPIRIKDLALDGEVIKDTLGISSGPMVGKLLESLLEEVIDFPVLNERDTLIERLKELYAQLIAAKECSDRAGD